MEDRWKKLVMLCGCNSNRLFPKGTGASKMRFRATSERVSRPVCFALTPFRVRKTSGARNGAEGDWGW